MGQFRAVNWGFLLYDQELVLVRPHTFSNFIHLLTVEISGDVEAMNQVDIFRGPQQYPRPLAFMVGLHALQFISFNFIYACHEQAKGRKSFLDLC